MSEKKEGSIVPSQEKEASVVNIFIDEEGAIQKLIEMEGEEWHKRDLEEERFTENTVREALAKAKKGGTGTIYGFGGFHRYYIRPDGRVDYSEKHGPSATKKARELGFHIQEQVRF